MHDVTAREASGTALSSVGYIGRLTRVVGGVKEEEGGEGLGSSYLVSKHGLKPFQAMYCPDLEEWSLTRAILIVFTIFLKRDNIPGIR